jgi:RNA polymerase sigma-70 factor (ECF subfamily)
MAQPALARSELEAALEALHEASYGWARSCCDGDPNEAADVLQSAYVKVLAGSAPFEGRAAFKTWLFGVIRLTAFEHRRDAARVRAIGWIQDLQAVGSVPPADADVLEAEQAEALRHALSRLPGRQRDVLHLVFYHGMSIADAAVVMDVSVGSARTHYERGKKKLRVLLSDGSG